MTISDEELARHEAHARELLETIRDSIMRDAALAHVVGALASAELRGKIEGLTEAEAALVPFLVVSNRIPQDVPAGNFVRDFVAMNEWFDAIIVNDFRRAADPAEPSERTLYRLRCIGLVDKQPQRRYRISATGLAMFHPKKETNK